MSEELLEQSHDELVNAFYPDAEAEPLEAPTDEAAEDETPEEAEELEVEGSAEDEAEESEESESSDEEAEDAEDVQTVEIDGAEHNLTDVQEWKEAHDNVKLMQADCTKKWQEAADLKKDAESQMTKAQDLSLELEALIAEDEEIDLKDLKEYDPDEYIKVTDRLAKRKAKVEELKANQPAAQSVLTQDELVAESNDFYAYDKEWLDKDNQLTGKFKSDMTLAQGYLKDRGYSQDEVNAITYSHHWKTIIDAAKFNAQKSKVKAIKKKVIKTPKAAKSKAQTKTLSAEEIFYGKK